MTAAPPRILQVIESTLGGTRRYLEDIVTALGDGPHNGLVYSLHRADDGFRALLERIRLAGWTLFELDMQRSINPQRDLSCMLELRKIYRAFRPDVVHAHSSKAGALARIATLGIPNRPGIVYSPHSIGTNISWIYRPIEHVLALRLDVLAAVSRSEQAELTALGLTSQKRIRVVYPTIHSEFFQPVQQELARRSLGLEEGPLVIAIGRLTAQKDPLAFVDFVAALRERVGDNVRALWVGDGELREQFSERAADLGLSETVAITGWIDDVRLHLAACDILVSTSAYESFGYVTAEAFAMDRPVVASRITGTVDIVTTDVNDQLYGYRDTDAAAELAAELLRNSGRAAAVAQRGREYVLSTFSADAMRRDLAGAYGAAMQR